MSPPCVHSFDAAIVLGAAVRPDGSPSRALARRVDHAVRLARGGMVGHLLMSGGPVAHSTPEAEIMREMALAGGVENGRISIEAASTNTIGNARLCAPIVANRGWSRLLLVTDACHIPRALYVFRRLGLAARPSAVWPGQWPALEWWGAWPRELAALPWTVARLELNMIGRKP